MALAVQADAEFIGDRYHPSAAFLDYIRLVRACAEKEGEQERFDLQARRETVTRELALRPATTMAGLFEKLCVWRLESFDAADDGFVYFDDWFPLSAWHDLARLLDADLAALSLPPACFESLQHSVRLCEGQDLSEAALQNLRSGQA